MTINTDLIYTIASEEVLDEAYAWLCDRRKAYSAEDDVWDLRQHWAERKRQLQRALAADDYAFGPLREVRLPDETLQVWRAQDALVLKAMAIVLGEALDPLLSARCFHLKGHGGAKAAVRETLERLTPDCHVMKSDVKGYYANIDHDILSELLAQYVGDAGVLRLVGLYIRRTITYGGNYWDVAMVITEGCSAGQPGAAWPHGRATPG